MNDLFKFNRPVIRKFKGINGEDAGDLPYIWAAYQDGCFDEIPEGLEMGAFVDFAEDIMNYVKETWIVEDYVNGSLLPVGFVVCKGTDWQLEPHVQYFTNASPRNILRTYVAFLKKTKYRKDIGACLVRVNDASKNLANRVERYGLLEYVGKVWNGLPTGNEYLYSIRCSRRK